MEDIYRKHERLMYYIAGKYSEVSVQREDIVQTAVLSLLKNEATLQRLPPYAQINYIAAAVRNTAINTIKRDQKEAARCTPLDDLTEDFPQTHIPGAEVRYLEKERQEELLTAFQGAGGEAIEVASGSQTRDDDALFAAKAKQYGFLASTGSDWHSPRSPRPTPGSQPQVPADLTLIWTKCGFPKDFCGQH